MHRHTPIISWAMLIYRIQLSKPGLSFTLFAFITSKTILSPCSVALEIHHVSKNKVSCFLTAFNIHPTKPLATDCSLYSFEVLFYPFSLEQQKDKNSSGFPYMKRIETFQKKEGWQKQKTKLLQNKVFLHYVFFPLPKYISCLHNSKAGSFFGFTNIT